jgi:hypothetical protein
VSAVKATPILVGETPQKVKEQQEGAKKKRKRTNTPSNETTSILVDHATTQKTPSQKTVRIQEPVKEVRKEGVTKKKRKNRPKRAISDIGEKQEVAPFEETQQKEMTTIQQEPLVVPDVAAKEQPDKGVPTKKKKRKKAMSEAGEKQEVSPFVVEAPQIVEKRQETQEVSPFMVPSSQVKPQSMTREKKETLPFVVEAPRPEEKQQDEVKAVTLPTRQEPLMIPVAVPDATALVPDKPVPASTTPPPQHVTLSSASSGSESDDEGTPSISTRPPTTTVHTVMSTPGGSPLLAAIDALQPSELLLSITRQRRRRAYPSIRTIETERIYDPFKAKVWTLDAPNDTKDRDSDGYSSDDEEDNNSSDEEHRKRKRRPGGLKQLARLV